MDKTEIIIDLKQETAFIEDYVSLRNRYRDLLLTTPVNVRDTRRWLRDSAIEAWGIAQGCNLLGAVVLYLGRNGEIAIFAEHQHQGLGTKLLKIIENVAKEKNVRRVWAWVLSDNVAAQRTFRKNGYTIEGESPRSYGNDKFRGILFEKEIL